MADSTRARQAGSLAQPIAPARLGFALAAETGGFLFCIDFMAFVDRSMSLCLAGLLIAALAGCAQSAAPPPTPAVKLSAGVALGQTGPEGTLMMFSVDYRFREGAPSKQSRYAWVIKPATGEPLEQIVKLTRQSTLQAIVPQWRPENGPFTSYIDEIAPDGTRRSLTEPIAMR